MFSHRFSTLGTHTIEIRPVGDGPIDFDAFLIVREPLLGVGSPPRSTREVPAGPHLLYCRGRIRSPMIEPGRGWGYLVLFSEIGVSLLVTTLFGVLVGHWVDKQLGAFPVFLIVGFLLGAGAGTLMIARLINRFLKSFD